MNGPENTSQIAICLYQDACAGPESGVQPGLRLCAQSTKFSIQFRRPVAARGGWGVSALGEEGGASAPPPPPDSNSRPCRAESPCPRPAAAAIPLPDPVRARPSQADAERFAPARRESIRRRRSPPHTPPARPEGADCARSHPRPVRTPAPPRDPGALRGAGRYAPAALPRRPRSLQGASAICAPLATRAHARPMRTPSDSRWRAVSRSGAVDPLRTPRPHALRAQTVHDRTPVCGQNPKEPRRRAAGARGTPKQQIGESTRIGAPPPRALRRKTRPPAPPPGRSAGRIQRADFPKRIAAAASCGRGSPERRVPCFEVRESDTAEHVQEILRVSEDRRASIRSSPSTIWHARIDQRKRLITKMLWTISV